jgi:hypothetical protein
LQRKRPRSHQLSFEYAISLTLLFGTNLLHFVVETWHSSLQGSPSSRYVLMSLTSGSFKHAPLARRIVYGDISRLLPFRLFDGCKLSLTSNFE